MDDKDKLLERTMARHGHSADALIEVLHAAQQVYGFLSPAVLAEISRKLKLPPSRVLGVATFYHLFRFEPERAHSAVVCLGTACYAAGGSDLMKVLEQHDHAHPGEWTLHAGRCVGSCGLAPVVVCDGETLSRATPPALEQHLGAEVAPS